MATFLKGINGAFSGKVGSTVGASWRQVNYMRSLPKPSKKAPSALQLAQRAKFALAVSFLSVIKDLLNVGYSDEGLGKSTGYNVALRHLIGTAITGSYPDFEVDYPNVVISKGNLIPPVGLQMAEAEPGLLRLTWTSILNTTNSFADDRLIFLLYNKTLRFFIIYEDGMRSDQQLDIELPTAFSGHELVGWAFMGHREGVRTSPSLYAGQVTVS